MEEVLKWTVSNQTKECDVKVSSVLVTVHGIQQHYNARFTLMLINNSKKQYNRNAVRTHKVSEANVQMWRQSKEKMINTKLA